MKTLRRQICPTIRIVDEKKGIATYVASDETLDSYREIIRAKGWRFDYFKRNAPFVDSHDYSTVGKLLGRVTDFAVKGNALEETVQWAIDVPENTLALLGWKMTVGGFLKGVSVGFRPVKYVSRWDSDQGGFQTQVLELGANAEQVRTIYTEQQQLELSAVILGANPNALAKAYKAGALADADVEYLAEEWRRSHDTHEFQEEETDNAKAAIDPALAAWAEARTADGFLGAFDKALSGI